MSFVVKPLVWKRVGSIRIAKHANATMWTIDRYNAGGYRLDCYPRPSVSSSSRHPTIAAAQRAAEVAWEAFVRAAVEETPSEDWTNEGRNP